MPIHPISFSIPECYIISKPNEKKKQIAKLIPGDRSTYIFTNQEEYYKEYQSSIFGITCKKGGWDCMRHYEILANGCIPKFEDLDDCPSTIMTHFPKELVKCAMKSSEPELYIQELLDYTSQYLSTRSMAQYILNKSGNPSPKRILFISGNKQPDYLRDLTLIGLKEILGRNCIDLCIIPHIYDDYESPELLYGSGFSYTKVISALHKPEVF